MRTELKVSLAAAGCVGLVVAGLAGTQAAAESPAPEPLPQTAELKFFNGDGNKYWQWGDTRVEVNLPDFDPPTGIADVVGGELEGEIPEDGGQLPACKVAEGFVANWFGGRQRLGVISPGETSGGQFDTIRDPECLSFALSEISPGPKASGQLITGATFKMNGRDDVASVAYFQGFQNGEPVGAMESIDFDGTELLSVLGTQDIFVDEIVVTVTGRAAGIKGFSPYAVQLELSDAPSNVVTGQIAEGETTDVAILDNEGVPQTQATATLLEDPDGTCPVTTEDGGKVDYLLSLDPIPGAGPGEPKVEGTWRVAQGSNLDISGCRFLLDLFQETTEQLIIEHDPDDVDRPETEEVEGSLFEFYRPDHCVTAPDGTSITPIQGSSLDNGDPNFDIGCIQYVEFFDEVPADTYPDPEFPERPYLGQGLRGHAVTLDGYFDLKLKMN